MHASERQARHECGGAILSARASDSRDYRYCDRCGAFTFDDGDLPDGADACANRAAWEEGEDSSPAGA